MVSFRTQSNSSPHLILFGGVQIFINTSRTVLGDTWIYDIESFTWRELTNFTQSPLARYGHGGILLNDSQLLVFGGTSQNFANLNDTWLLDLNSNNWQLLNTTATNSSTPDSRSEHVMALFNGIGGPLILMWGGCISTFAEPYPYCNSNYQSSALNLTWIFSPSNMTWTSRPIPNTPAYWNAAVSEIRIQGVQCLLQFGGVTNG
jgi:hypothetical protein